MTDEQEARRQDEAKLAGWTRSELERTALLKCWEVERTSGFGDLATLASTVCSAALDLAEHRPHSTHHVNALHRAADFIVQQARLASRSSSGAPELTPEPIAPPLEREAAGNKAYWAARQMCDGPPEQYSAHAWCAAMHDLLGEVGGDAAPRVETEGDAADGVVVAGEVEARGLLVTIRFPHKVGVTIGQHVTARFAPYVGVDPKEGT